MPITDQHKEYNSYLKIWRRMRAVIGGEDYIKGWLGEGSSKDFLPDLDDTTTPDRYQKYVERAVYYNFTGWTWQGLLGAIFRKEGQETVLPPEIEYTINNIDGTNVGLMQHCRETTGEVLEVGRVGLLVDYPQVETTPTAAEDTRRAYVVTYRAEDLFNWRTEIRDGQLLLTQVRIWEKATKDKDEFTTEEVRRIRVLDLDPDGWYRHRLFAEDGAQIGGDIYPRRADGSRFPYIPFVFVGSDDNRPNVDVPPLLDIANINIGHYRNSADMEENLFVHGQGTMFLWSELSVEDFKQANPGGIRVGSRSAHFLGAGGGAQLLQVDGSNALPGAMQAKVDMMVGLGARFISEPSGNKPVGTAQIEASQQTSGIVNLIMNVENAYRMVLRWMTDFMGGDPDAISFELNKDLFDQPWTAQEITAAMMLADSGVVAKSDLRAKARATGYLDPMRTDEEIDSEIMDNGE